MRNNNNNNNSKRQVGCPGSWAARASGQRQLFETPLDSERTERCLTQRAARDVKKAREAWAWHEWVLACEPAQLKESDGAGPRS